MSQVVCGRCRCRNLLSTQWKHTNTLVFWISSSMVSMEVIQPLNQPWRTSCQRSSSEMQFLSSQEPSRIARDAPLSITFTLVQNCWTKQQGSSWFGAPSVLYATQKEQSSCSNHVDSRKIDMLKLQSSSVKTWQDRYTSQPRPEIQWMTSVATQLLPPAECWDEGLAPRKRLATPSTDPTWPEGIAWCTWMASACMFWRCGSRAGPWLAAKLQCCCSQRARMLQHPHRLLWNPVPESCSAQTNLGLGSKDSSNSRHAAIPSGCLYVMIVPWSKKTFGNDLHTNSQKQQV